MSSPDKRPLPVKLSKLNETSEFNGITLRKLMDNFKLVQQGAAENSDDLQTNFKINGYSTAAQAAEKIKFIGQANSETAIVLNGALNLLRGRIYDSLSEAQNVENENKVDENENKFDEWLQTSNQMEFDPSLVAEFVVKTIKNFAESLSKFSVNGEEVQVKGMEFSEIMFKRRRLLLSPSLGLFYRNQPNIMQKLSSVVENNASQPAKKRRVRKKMPGHNFCRACKEPFQPEHEKHKICNKEECRKRACTKCDEDRVIHSHSQCQACKNSSPVA